MAEVEKKEFWAGSLDDTPVGPMSAVVSRIGLVRLVYGRLDLLKDEYGARLQPTNAPVHLDRFMEELRSYLAGSLRDFQTPVDWAGMTQFNRAALEACAGIPYGQVRTYGQLAASLGRPAAARAVGSAMAHNPMPIILPCHRVIGSDGSLRGYGGSSGLETKAWLLKLEGYQLI
jgi:methylated-DNA-[protein]-cysteine S-methyltransferase